MSTNKARSQQEKNTRIASQKAVLWQYLDSEAMHTTNSPDRSTRSLSHSPVKNEGSKMMVPAVFGWKNPFSRGAAALKRSSRLSRKALEAKCSNSSSVTCASSTAHTRVSLDPLSSWSDLETSAVPSDCDATSPPASTATPETLKRKKLRKRAMESLDLSEKSIDERKVSRRQSSKKGADGKSDSFRKSKKETGSPKTRKSKKTLLDLPGENPSKSEAVAVDDKSFASTKTKKTKKKKKKTDKEAGESGKKKKTKRKSKSKESSSKTKRVPRKDAVTKQAQLVIQRSVNSLPSYGFSLGESLISGCDASSTSHSLRSDFSNSLRSDFTNSLRSDFTNSLRSDFSNSLRSDFTNSLRGDFDASSIRSEFGTRGSKSAHTRSLCSRPLHRRSSSLKPCLRKSSKVDPTFSIAENFPSFPSHEECSVASQPEKKPESQSSSIKLDDFIRRQRPCFDPFEEFGDKKSSFGRSTESFCGRYTTASSNSIDIDDVFAMGSSYDGTRSTSGSMDLASCNGSTHTRSMSPGRLARRKKAVMNAWTAPVDASIHWSSCHERRSIDNLSVSSNMNHSFHGGVTPTRITTTSSNHSKSERGNNRASGLLKDSRSSHDASQDDLKDHDASTVGDEDEFVGEDVDEKEIADDMFDSDIEDENMSDDELKGGDDNDNGGQAKNEVNQRRKLDRTMSDTSFESMGWSAEECAGFEDSEQGNEQDDLLEYRTTASAPSSASPSGGDKNTSFPFEILQMTPRTKTKFMTKRKQQALAAAAVPAM